jgi:signal transduction histidine kinase
VTGIVRVLDPEQVALASALSAERLLNARRTHRIRLVGVTLFAALFLVLGVLLGDPAWQTNWVALVAYFALAAGLDVTARHSDTIARWLTLAPALLDMPLVYLLQRGQYATTPTPSAVAGFTLGPLVLLLAISALSVQRWQLALAAVVAATLEVLLQVEAGVSVGARVSAVVVVGLAAAVLAYSSERLAALLVRTSRQQKLAALGQLSAGVGHDLRNPLAAVANSIFVLGRRLEKAGHVDERLREPLDLAKRELAACQRIITDLLDYAREAKLELEPIEVRTLIDECVGLVFVPAHVALAVDVAPSVGLVPLARDRVRQVLVNLVQNAVEAIPDSRRGQVRVAANRDSNALVLTVADDGVGMTPETKARIFEPLFTTKKQGTGLGLAIVESLVRQHGGQLTLDSAPGRGTTFTVRLPTVG